MMALRLHIKRELGADGINTSLLKQERQSGWKILKEIQERKIEFSILLSLFINKGYRTYPLNPGSSAIFGEICFALVFMM